MEVLGDRNSNARRARGILAVLLAVILTVTTLPIVTALGQTGEDAGGRPAIAVTLTGILEKFDKALEKLQAVGIPALEEQLEGIIALLEDLLEGLANPSSKDEENPSVRGQIVKLDLMLHRLVFMLEKLIERQQASQEPSPAQEKAQHALAELRVWIDGYIAGITAHMDQIEARKFEQVAQTMLGEIGKQLVKVAQRGFEQEPEKGRLEILVERIKALLSQLDMFIIRTFGRPPIERPLLQAP